MDRRIFLLTTLLVLSLVMATSSAAAAEPMLTIQPIKTVAPPSINPTHPAPTLFHIRPGMPMQPIVTYALLHSPDINQASPKPLPVLSAASRSSTPWTPSTITVSVAATVVVWHL